MSYRNLADFLDDLGRAGELAAIDAEVDPCLEAAEVTRRVARQKGPALLFRNVRGHDIPLLTNVFGTESRILKALAADSIDEAAARIDRALNSGGNEGWLERLRFGSKSGATASYAANRVKSGACQQVVCLGGDIDLRGLPLIARDWQAAKPSIHSATILSAEPKSHAQVFLHGDVHIEGRDTAVVAWSEIAGPARLEKAYRDAGGRMPIAIVIGGDPIVRLAAAAPLPPGVDPLGLAGLLRERPLDAVACHSIDLLVPAEADIIIEGWIDPAECAATQGHDLSSPPRHLLHVTAVTHRANRVFSSIVLGGEVREAHVCERLVARLFLPYLKTQMPELVDFDLRPYASDDRAAILAMEKSYPTEPRHVATVAWGMRPFQFARLLVLVDADVGVHDLERVMEAIVRNVDWKENVFVLDGGGSCGRPSRRVALDATRRCDPQRDVATETLVSERWAEYGLGPEAQP